MKLESLKPAKGATKTKKRIGRGQGSGRGGTSTKGHKGAQSRAGYSSKRGFEGGQMPLQRRVPKFGFKNTNKITYKPINLDTLQSLFETRNINVINTEVLLNNGLIGNKDKVKILGRGELKSAINVEIHYISQKAKEIIEKNGGKVVILESK